MGKFKCTAEIVTIRDSYSVDDFIHNGQIRTDDLISDITRLGLSSWLHYELMFLKIGLSKKVVTY